MWSRSLLSAFYPLLRCKISFHNVKNYHNSERALRRA
jgi:hypothetical protein